MCKDICVIAAALEVLDTIKTQRALVKAREAITLLQKVKEPKMQLFYKTVKVAHCSWAELQSILEILEANIKVDTTKPKKGGWYEKIVSYARRSISFCGV